MKLPDKKINLTKIRTTLKTFYWFNPLNLIKEKEKFFKSKTYNPRFIYPKPPIKIFSKYLQYLETIEIKKDDSIRNIIKKNKIKETKIKIKLILAQGTHDITKYSSQLYQLRFDKQTLKNALKDSTISSSLNRQANFTQKQIINQFRQYLNQYQKTGWTIIQSNRCDFYFQVRPKKQLISIGNNISWEYGDLNSVLAHEIDGHVVRYINSQKQTNPLFKRNFPFYIKTEEGLACLLSDYFSKNGFLSRKHHALKYLAGFIALNSSFRETYNFFVDNGFTQNLAFQRTARLKKGFHDTAIAGCNAREAIYYEGMMEVKKYLENGGSIKKLFAGKVGLDDIDIIPIPVNQIIPHRLKTYSDNLNFSRQFVSNYL